MSDEAAGARLAAELAVFVDVLIPGDADFPSARDVGVQAKMPDRLDHLAGAEAHRRLARALADCGGPLQDRRPDERAAVVRRLEVDHEDLFLAALKAAYLGYYENPAVHVVIRSLGHPYNSRLLPEGYGVEPFDPAVDAPRHGRGHCLATGDVRRVPLDGLDFLQGASGGDER